MERKISEIETLDAKRMRTLELYLVGVAVFIVLSVTRFFFRLGELNSQPIGIAVFAGLILSLALISVSTIRSESLKRRLNQDPALKEALNNELVQNLELKSWRAAYLGAVGAAVFFAVVSFFYPISDPVLTALTAIIAGGGAYQATFYFRYRSS
jgi:hypothetical protein